MATVESSATATSTSASSVTVTKPTGLAEGDLMVAYVASNDATDVTLNTPSGWTSAYNVAHSSSSNANKTACFYKLASSADASASNFTFSATQAQNGMVAGILRVSGVWSVTPVAASEWDRDEDLGTTASFTASTTPTFDDSLVLFGISKYNGATHTVSDYATTPSYSFTEVFDEFVDVGSDPQISVAYATASATEITAYQATVPASTYVIGSLLVINSQTVTNVTVRNVQGAGATGTSLTITKPTGLTVGDAMVACIVSGGTNSTPSGWTAQTSTVGFQTFYTKTADSSDVAASDFTFTSSGSPMIGALYAIEGASLDVAVGSVQEGVVTGSAIDAPFTVSSSCSITPVISGAILIHAGACYDTDNDYLTWDNRVITGGTNPTWTERYESQQSSGANTASISVADAIYNETTTITAIAADADLPSGSVNAEPHAMLVLNPASSTLGSTALLSATPAIFVPSPQSSTSGTVDALLENADEDIFDPASSVIPNIWTNESKPSGTWTNET